MQRHPPLGWQSLPRRSRLEPAPVWRQLAAETIDSALRVGFLRVVKLEPPPPEFRAAEKLAALREGQERGENPSPRELNEAKNEFASEFFAELGTVRPWTLQRALHLLATRVIWPSVTAWTGGWTPGGLLLSVRVVRSDGRPLTVRHSLVRQNAISMLADVSLWPFEPVTRGRAKLMLLPLYVVWAFLDPDRRSPGELLAGTRVVAET